MHTSTFNAFANENHLDTPVEFTLHDAISYAEFEEELNSWEDSLED